MRTTRLMTLITAGLLATACGEGTVEPELPSDDEGASFGGGKADHAFSDCQMIEALKVVNESAADIESLVAKGVNRRAAENIVEHRFGPDGVEGTADDDLFDNFDELDAVPFVGPVTLEQIVGVINDRCHDHLDRPFIDRNTFANSTGGGFTRDSVELEAAMTVNGITGRHLHSILTDTDSRGRTIFSRIRRVKEMEGLTYEYPVDEVPWSNSTMRVREALPFVSLSIESGRFEVDPDDDSGERELSVGTDIMDDTYYDTKDYTVLENDMVVRGRIRWDTDESVRRLLIAAKLDSEVDEEGLKRAAKIDVRTEGGRHLATLDDDVRSGTVGWSGSRVPIEPVEAVYRRLEERDVLPTIEGHEDVLLLDPQAHIRSERSRYHLNEASLNALKRYYANGLTRIEETNAFLDERIASGQLDPNVQAQAEQLRALGAGILDGSLVEAELGTTPSTVRVDEFVAPTTREELDNQKLIAELTYDLTHRYAETLDALDNDLAGTNRLDFDEFIDMFVAWRRSVDTGLAKKTIARPFLEDHQDIVTAGTLDAAFDEFNTFAAAQQTAGNGDFDDFQPMTQEIFDALGKHLRDEDLGDTHRMIATTGIMAKALWFDNAREFYVPDSRRSNFSNFIIDTMDFTMMLSQHEWETVPEAERTPAFAIDPAKIFHSVLVNEVQIELGSEKPYLDRMEALKAELAATPSAETEAMLEGARFVFGEYRKSLTTIAQVKGGDIIDRLEDEGAPGTIAWEPAAASKGKTALLILSDKDGN